MGVRHREVPHCVCQSVSDSFYCKVNSWMTDPVFVAWGGVEALPAGRVGPGEAAAAQGQSVDPGGASQRGVGQLQGHDAASRAGLCRGRLVLTLRLRPVHVLRQQRSLQHFLLVRRRRCNPQVTTDL